PQPRPQLPVSVRRHVLAELDVPFAAIVALTFLLHVGVVAYLRQVDWPRKPSVDELPDRFLHEILRPRPAPPKVARPAPKSATPDRPKRAAKPSGAELVRAPKPVEAEAERRARLEK